MQFDTFAEFLAMGGHAQYVWMAYGTAAVVFIAYAVSITRSRTRIMEELKWRAQSERTQQGEQAKASGDRIDGE